MSTKPGAMTDEVMTKEARKRAVLRFLEDTGLALPPKAIFLNMKDRGATFSERTLNRHLPELEEEGLIRRLPDQKGAYFEISEKGREHLRELEADDS